VVLAGSVLGLGAVISVLMGSFVPGLLALVAVALVGLRPGLYRLRHRRQFALAREARKRVSRTYPTGLDELRNMVAQSAAGLTALVHEMCQTADLDGRALVIEVDEDDEMATVWRTEGFRSEETVEMPWGRVELLVRPPSTGGALTAATANDQPTRRG